MYTDPVTLALTLGFTLFGLLLTKFIVLCCVVLCCVVPLKLRCWAVFKFTKNRLSSVFQNVALKAVDTIGNYSI